MTLERELDAPISRSWIYSAVELGFHRFESKSAMTAFPELDESRSLEVDVFAVPLFHLGDQPFPRKW